ncbi:MAG: TIR domain-containing protein [Bacteroidota bacterium]|nr:TIR domain-containing protein [Bacteroidota bacterium]MDP4215488.1 TIR domain-containing protein [Bacteroidota bacterium]MDP4246718.1 TIR domain-containing protein [Bacteroidota bacterium]MDP4252555.1 TIR domain-containing protein [Bacteroidota bacterium]MDP4257809.1 TIR domain-containing protein [Bacteroidota bacterium]
MLSRTKVYISFDYDRDKALKDLLVGQANNEGSPFEIADGSLHEAEPDDEWEEKARERIGRADTVIVLLGHKTHRAPGVLKEVKIARELGKRVIQIIGYKDRQYTRVPQGGVLYNWTWENLVKILGGPSRP